MSNTNTQTPATFHNPVKFVKSKMAVNNGEVKTLYTCAKTASHAMVDITSRYVNGNEATADAAVIDLYLIDTILEVGIPAKKYALFLNLQVDNKFIYPELGKVIVGPGQSIVAHVKSGDTINFRVTGDEYQGMFIKRAGRLNGVETKNANLYEIFRLDDPLASNATVTVSVFNPDTVSSNTEVFISESATPLPVDNIMYGDIPPGNSAFLENTRIGVGERILVKSTAKNLIFTINGVEITSVIGTCQKDPKP